MSSTDTLLDVEILLAQPRGFCAGVDRAIEIVERAIALFGAPIYVRHEIVHNAYVVEDLRKKGAVFIDPVWRGMMQWHAVTNNDWDREQARTEFAGLFGTRPDGAALQRDFDSLEQEKEAA